METAKVSLGIGKIPVRKDTKFFNGWPQTNIIFFIAYLTVLPIIGHCIFHNICALENKTYNGYVWSWRDKNN